MQCVICHKWINADKAIGRYNEEEINFEINSDDSDDYLYPNGYHTLKTDVDFCTCCIECENKKKELENKKDI